MTISQEHMDRFAGPAQTVTDLGPHPFQTAYCACLASLSPCSNSSPILGRDVGSLYRSFPEQTRGTHLSELLTITCLYLTYEDRQLSPGCQSLGFYLQTPATHPLSNKGVYE